MSSESAPLFDPAKAFAVKQTHGVSICIFGATGDLAKKKTYPAIFHLFAQGLISRETLILGYARSDVSAEELRQKLRPFLEKEAAARKFEEHVTPFLNQCDYVAGSYDAPDGFKQLAKKLEEHEEKCCKANPPGRLFYLALPPHVFIDASKQIKENCMVNTENGAWNRVVVEKPFGHDLKSSNELALQLGQLFTEDEIYRIDHYLGKEIVQNTMILRFTNAIFSSMWNKGHIRCVMITFKEPFGTEGRGAYFDKSGIIRDILQNHLLQVMAVVAMEPPINATPEAIRDEKTKVLKYTRVAKLEETVLGQYEANGGNPGYLDDPGVPKDSKTPTFATTVLHVDNDRWRGVPFILKAGKALDDRKAEIRIQFHTPTSQPFGQIPHNELVMRLQPDEAIYLKVNTKTPGLHTDILQSELDLTYQERFLNVIPDAYERLILDVVRGDHQHFVRTDELEAAWTIFDPLLKQIENGEGKLLGYKYGSRGPLESDQLVKEWGYVRHEKYEWRKK